MPKISVLIPTYNYAQYLDEAVQSVINQTYQDFELIVIDNNSSDNTAYVLSKYENNPKIKIITNNKNIGMAQNWNKCILESSGEYIKFLNADDFLESRCLEKLAKVLDDDLSISLVTSYKNLVGNKKTIITLPFVNKIDGFEAIKNSLEKNGNWIGEPTVVMFRRRDLYIGLFNIEFKWLPDWDLWIRLLMVGNLYIIPEVLSNFRIHNDQETKILKGNNITIFEEYRYYKYLHNSNNLVNVELDNKIKEKATEIFINIPVFFKNKKYSLIFRAITYAFNEYILLKSFFNLVKAESKKYFFEDKLKKDSKKLLKSLKNNKSSNIVLYGANDLCGIISENLQQRNIKHKIVDSNPDKIGSFFHNLAIQELKSLNKDEKWLFVITARNPRFISEIENLIKKEYLYSGTIRLK